MIGETYGVNLTPHFEKYQYQTEETSDIQHATWNFGNLLKAKGYSIAYMHGPIGLYEGHNLHTVDFEFKVKGADIDNFAKIQKQLEDFVSVHDEYKDHMLLFLFQKTPDSLCFAMLDKEKVQEARQAAAQSRKRKKKVVDVEEKPLDKSTT